MSSENKHTLILISVNQCYTETVLKTARSLGARGGTILRARWSGVKALETYHGTTTRFISGKVMASPDMAIGPTPRPIKIESTILYSDVTSAATMAGREYWTNSVPMGFVPRSLGDDTGLVRMLESFVLIEL